MIIWFVTGTVRSIFFCILYFFTGSERPILIFLELYYCYCKMGLLDENVKRVNIIQVFGQHRLAFNACVCTSNVYLSPVRPNTWFFFFFFKMDSKTGICALPASLENLWTSLCNICLKPLTQILFGVLLYKYYREIKASFLMFVVISWRN